MPAYRPRILAAAAKPEVESGTDSVPTLAANALGLVGIPALNSGFLEGGLRDDVVFGGLGTIDRAAPAGRFGTIDLTLEVKGFGAAYSAANRPEMDPLLRGCGMSAVVDATPGSEEVTYATLDDGFETFSLYLWSASKLYKLVGCVATFRFAFVVNNRVLATFSVTGRIATDPAQQALGAVTLNQTIPPLWHTATTSIGAWDGESGEPLIMTRLEADLANTIVPRPSAGATDGLIGHYISDRKARVSTDVEQVALATFDPYAISKQPGGAGATDTELVTHVGNTQYNRMRLFTGRIALEPPTHSEVNGLAGWGLAGNLVAGTEAVSGRELRLVFD